MDFSYTRKQLKEKRDEKIKFQKKCLMKTFPIEKVLLKVHEYFVFFYKIGTVHQLLINSRCNNNRCISYRLKKFQRPMYINKIF